jgi:hypothetical protein
MPSLINDPYSQVALNYRKSAPSTRFGTPELVHALISFDDLNMTDYDTVDGNFNQVVTIVQRFAEIYAIGAAQYGGQTSHITFILKAGTVTDPNYSNSGEYDPINNKSVSLQYELEQHFEQNVSINYTTMFGLAYE